MTEYWAELTAKLRSVVPSGTAPERADDAVQVVLEAIWRRHLAHGKELRKPTAYLRVCIRRALLSLAARDREVPATGEPVDSLNLVAQNVVPLGLAGQRTAFLERHDGAIVQTPWYRSVLAALQPHEWQLVILDPLSRWGGPEVETDAYAATELVTLLETLTKAPGNPTVIAAHHERKGMGGTSDASSVRGSSALVDGPRWVANLRRRKDSELLELAVTKANNTVPPPPIVLKRGPMGVLRRATVDEIEDEKRIERPAWTLGAPRGGVGENQL